MFLEPHLKRETFTTLPLISFLRYFHVNQPFHQVNRAGALVNVQ